MFQTKERKHLKYQLEYNPVQNIPEQGHLEKAGKGQLMDWQIWEVWHLAPTIMGKPGLVAQLLLALGVGSPSGWFTIGMIRCSISTRMNEAGVSKMIKEKIAGHNQNDVTTTHYDVWEYKKEKREAADLWESYLKKIISLPYEEVTDRLPEEMV